MITLVRCRDPSKTICQPFPERIRPIQSSGFPGPRAGFGGAWRAGRASGFFSGAGASWTASGAFSGAGRAAGASWAATGAGAASSGFFSGMVSVSPVFALYWIRRELLPPFTRSKVVSTRITVFSSSSWTASGAGLPAEMVSGVSGTVSAEMVSGRSGTGAGAGASWAAFMQAASVSRIQAATASACFAAVNPWPYSFPTAATASRSSAIWWIKNGIPSAACFMMQAARSASFAVYFIVSASSFFRLPEGFAVYLKYSASFSVTLLSVASFATISQSASDGETVPAATAATGKQSCFLSRVIWPRLPRL